MNVTEISNRNSWRFLMCAWVQWRCPLFMLSFNTFLLIVARNTSLVTKNSHFDNISYSIWSRSEISQNISTISVLQLKIQSHYNSEIRNEWVENTTDIAFSIKRKFEMKCARESCAWYMPLMRFANMRYERNVARAWLCGCMCASLWLLGSFN